jgi:hypothetical protein
MARSIDWLGAGTSGVSAEGPALRLFLRSAPNPVQLRSTLQFSLPAAGAASLKVFGADGRLVRVLVDGPTTAGEHTVDWNLTDTRGQRVPAGVYFYRLEGGGVTASAKTLLLR